jgi:hypothetical protein
LGYRAAIGLVSSESSKRVRSKSLTQASFDERFSSHLGSCPGESKNWSSGVIRISELRDQSPIPSATVDCEASEGGDPLDRRLGKTEERKKLGMRPGMGVLLVRLEGQTVEGNEVRVL